MTNDCVRAGSYDPTRLEREVLATGLHDPLQMEVLPNGDVLIAEMDGALKRWRAATLDLVEIGRVPVAVGIEVGLMGVAAAGDFASSGNVFLFFCPAAKRDVLRLARFAIGTNGLLDMASEKILLEYPIEFNGAIHMGGGLFFDKATGNLILGTGDNSPPFSGPPVDISDNGQMRDALRSSANSMDLRGKILRLRPRDDGGYDIPPGNLFNDPKLGRPEIFAMGVRNGFHSSVDPKTGWIAWGDVGPNTDPANGSVGYDEFNLATKAGNFGHPMFTGANEAYRGSDGKLFDAAHPLNNSPRNTGLKELPPAQPALLWYPTTPSKEFPELGSGARSAMAGAFYHFDEAVKSELKLPQHFDGVLFINEWTRNWIKAVRLTADGKLAGIEPFASEFAFRKPMDIKMAPDHSLILLEYGDKWHGNTDGQLSRIVYRSGNRPPVAVLSALPLAGKQPLDVSFDASGSHDADGGDLRFSWDFGNGKTSSEASPRFTFTDPGQHIVALKVTDAAGAVSETRTVVTVGNAAPVVDILSPPNGGFFDNGQDVYFQIRVTDSEDGDNIDPNRVLVQGAYKAARSGDAVHPGLVIMQRSTCFACHTVRDKSAGPSYMDIARKYQNDAPARERLAAKIISGGVGVWGQQIPMPPHPQHALAETQLMVDWILGLPSSPEAESITGLAGKLKTKAGGERQEGGVFVITAVYDDNGAAGLPRLRGSAEHVLHARKRKAAMHDGSKDIEVVDFFEGESGLNARFTNGGWLKFSRVNLDGIQSLILRLDPTVAVAVEVRAGSPTGPLVAKTESLDPAGDFREVTIPVTNPGGLNDLVFIACTALEQKGSALDLNWVQFQPAVHAGFFTPQRKGKLWDTWMYFHEGKYYQFYLGGDFLKWDTHALAVSPDGVHWEDRGTTVERGAGVTWMGTGHIWEAPDFATSHKWISNYSEHIGEKQDIKFATSTDLLHWTKADEKFHFTQDTRWYKANGRWDCIDTIKRADGGFYGYFTADPDPEKVKYKCCGFGFAESKDGLAWTALPPVEGDMTGEFGGIQQIGDKYFILISEGRVGVGDKAEGPFLSQKKNPNAFGEGCEIYFPRFFHNAPGGPLVNHFYNNDWGKVGDVYSAPLKSVEVDKEGILRLKWWNGNDKLKANEVTNPTQEGGGLLKFLKEKLDLSHTHVIEGTTESPQKDGARSIYFELGNNDGRCLRFANNEVQFGEIKPDGSNFKALQTSNRDLDFGPTQNFRLVLRADMAELYVNDYLMNLKRFNWNGRLGFMSENSGASFKNVRIWRGK